MRPMAFQRPSTVRSTAFRNKALSFAKALVSKYADHLLLYRQAQIYARQGVVLDRSTLADWVGRAAPVRSGPRPSDKNQS